MTNWDLRYASQKLGELDLSLLTPCTGDKDCPTCVHLQEEIGDLTKLTGEQTKMDPIKKRKAKEHRELLKVHKNHRKNYGGS